MTNGTCHVCLQKDGMDCRNKANCPHVGPGRTEEMSFLARIQVSFGENKRKL